MDNLKKLQRLLKQSSLESFLLPINDEFLSEYVKNNRLKWLTGFTGSFAITITTQNQCYFFTDSRYTTQAKNELCPQNYTIIDITQKKPWELAKELNFDIYYDPKITTEKFLNNFSNKASQLKYNPIDLIHENAENTDHTEIKHHPIEYSGISSLEKCKKVADKRYPIFLTDPESVCWLLNIRGNDVPFTPVILSKAILYPDGNAILFISNKDYVIDIKESNYQIAHISRLENHLKLSEKIILDKRKVSEYYIDIIGEDGIIDSNDPCDLPKACKNDAEIQGAINAHKRDGVAIKLFLDWLEDNIPTTEIHASKMLRKFREEQSLFQGMSFETISAFGANAAIVHYHPSKTSDANITRDNLYLFDSGAQYLDGTTDVTRTVCFGVPTKEQKFHYTLVLKAHIALASAVFPVGTTGKQLDTLARIHLWKHGLNYGHGTGHGVGSYLNVHEGPQSMGNNIPLKEGMIISNEPGIYKEGHYGIRLENLMHVAKRDDKYMYFKTLTQASFEEKLIDQRALTPDEITWLSNYHKSIQRYY